MDSKKIGELIKKRRKELDITQQELGDRVGVSYKAVSKWECGNSMPDISILKNVCDVLKISVEEILDGKEKKIINTKKLRKKYIYIIAIFVIIGIILLFLIFKNFNRNVRNDKKVNEYECILTKTYTINNISKSNDENYLYVTLKEFQIEGVFTIKLSKTISRDLEIGKSYEFTFNTYKNIIDKTADKVFSNSEIINIIVSDKIGIEQTNNYICN